LISHVIGPATEASNPPAPCHTFMKASCNTSSARSLLFNIRNPQQMRAGGAVHPLERRAIPQRDARQQSGKIFVGEHGGRELVRLQGTLRRKTLQAYLGDLIEYQDF
jgi:hypothetical protein